MDSWTGDSLVAVLPWHLLGTRREVLVVWRTTTNGERRPAERARIMTTEKEDERVAAFLEVVRDFRKTHGTSQVTMRDMLLGVLAGTACRLGESREGFEAQVVRAYDEAALVTSGPMGIMGLSQPAPEREAPVDIYGDVLEQLWDGETLGPSDQIPLHDVLRRNGIAATKQTERAYIIGRTDEYCSTKPRFPIGRQRKGLER